MRDIISLYMDEEIAELKDLVQKSVALAEDTNRVVRKMHRAQIWARFFQLLWWVVIIGVSGATYYLYFQPYVGKIEQLYEQAQVGTEQVHNWNTQIENFFKSVGGKGASGQSAPQ